MVADGATVGAVLAMRILQRVRRRSRGDDHVYRIPARCRQPVCRSNLAADHRWHAVAASRPQRRRAAIPSPPPRDSGRGHLCNLCPRAQRGRGRCRCGREGGVAVGGAVGRTLCRPPAAAAAARARRGSGVEGGGSDGKVGCARVGGCGRRTPPPPPPPECPRGLPPRAPPPPPPPPPVRTAGPSARIPGPRRQRVPTGPPPRGGSRRRAPPGRPPRRRRAPSRRGGGCAGRDGQPRGEADPVVGRGSGGGGHVCVCISGSAAAGGGQPARRQQRRRVVGSGASTTTQCATPPRSRRWRSSVTPTRTGWRVRGDRP
ncbi:hypothetical protein I4F81_002859 [Pyropia yezoensis]|uniref:Uncharacterized protein n=1 Tax=Pyropia yezoensis TaxID=2788 RepID=A0ACC3BR94_PYRYE|nr:hypothetical protein I4F81_002859 [Neopyropia yezoensis]